MSNRATAHVVGRTWSPTVACRVLLFWWPLRLTHASGLWVFAAAVAVATSDTWASEFGCLDDRVRMITTLRRCEPGLNGGVSPRGQAAAFGGAALIAGLSFAVAVATAEGEMPFSGIEPIVVLLAGFLGCQMDSLLGAVLENRGLMTKGTVNAASILCGSLAVALVLDSLEASRVDVGLLCRSAHHRPCGGRHFCSSCSWSRPPR